MTNSYSLTERQLVDMGAESLTYKAKYGELE